MNCTRCTTSAVSCHSRAGRRRRSAAAPPTRPARPAPAGGRRAAVSSARQAAGLHPARLDVDPAPKGLRGSAHAQRHDRGAVLQLDAAGGVQPAAAAVVEQHLEVALAQRQLRSRPGGARRGSCARSSAIARCRSSGPISACRATAGSRCSASASPSAAAASAASSTGGRPAQRLAHAPESATAAAPRRPSGRRRRSGIIRAAPASEAFLGPQSPSVTVRSGAALAGRPG